MEHGHSSCSDTGTACSAGFSLHGQRPADFPSFSTKLATTSDASMPRGFSVEPEGIYFHAENDMGDAGTLWICSPISVVGLCRRSCGKGWSRVVDVVDPDGRTHRLLLDEALFNGAPTALLRPLLDHGLQVAKGSAARKHVADLLVACRLASTGHDRASLARGLD